MPTNTRTLFVFGPPLAEHISNFSKLSLRSYMYESILFLAKRVKKKNSLSFINQKALKTRVSEKRGRRRSSICLMAVAL